MRHIFHSRYKLGNEEIAAILTDGAIVLDANILLDLYRIGKSQRDAVLKVLEHPRVSPRLWLPYQAGLEFQRRRLDVAREHRRQYDDVKNALESAVSSLTTTTNNKVKDPDVKKTLTSAFEKTLTPAINTVVEQLVKLQNDNVLELNQVVNNDLIRPRLDAIFVGELRVGKAPRTETLEQLKLDVQERYAQQKPPGFKDAGKGQNAEGDGLIWLEILDYAKSNETDVLFVSNDVKDDWMEPQIDGVSIGPRAELREEFREHTGRTYHQLDLEGFLHHANEGLNIGISNATIESLKELSDPATEVLSRLRHPSILGRLDRYGRDILSEVDYMAIERVRNGIDEPDEQTIARARRAIRRLDQIEHLNHSPSRDGDASFRALDNWFDHDPVGAISSFESLPLQEQSHMFSALSARRRSRLFGDLSKAARVDLFRALSPHVRGQLLRDLPETICLAFLLDLPPRDRHRLRRELPPSARRHLEHLEDRLEQQLLRDESDDNVRWMLEEDLDGHE